MYWNNSCLKLSTKLGLPDTIHKSTLYDNMFRDKYKFSFFKDIKSGNVEFQEIPISDNSLQKRNSRNIFLIRKIKDIILS